MEPKDKQFRSEEVLTEIRNSLEARKIVDVEEKQIKIVIFEVGGQSFAFFGKNVLEILSGREIFPVPFLPEHIPGLINVRGEIEAAIDISRFLGCQGKITPHGMIIMIHQDSFRSGIIVDRVEDVLDVPMASIKPPLTTLTGVSRDLVSGSIDFSGKTVAILDMEKLASRVTP